MKSRWQFYLLQFSRLLWVRAAFFCLLSVGTALVAVVISPYIPDGLETKVGANAVDNILNIIASSMLTVTTFSLSVMVAAYSAATTSVTPRATKLLMADTTTQNVLATFIGSFLFSLVGIIALSMGVYGNEGRVVLFVVTIAVILIIVVTLLRWIDHLARFGRVNETTASVEETTARALRARLSSPYLGGTPLHDPQNDIPLSAMSVVADSIGYVQHIDVGMLADYAGEVEATIYVNALPGAFVTLDRPLAFIAFKAEDETRVVADGIAGKGEGSTVSSAVMAAFTIGKERSFDQDPRFGLSVITEIASRALSPGINDPGTAIDVLSRCVRLLSIWTEKHADAAEPVDYPSVCVPGIDIDECFDDVFTPIGRDGAGLVEVQIRLQKSLIGLAEMGGPRYRRNALRHCRVAWQRASEALTIDEDRQRVLYLARRLDPSLSDDRTG